MHRTLTLCAVAIGIVAAPAFAQSTVVAPDGYANLEGPNNNAYPWSRNAASMRIQFVYDSSHFTNQAVNFPILIQALSYRADDTTSSWTGGVWPNVQIDMATCPLDYASASGTFANNLGVDQMTVLSGPVTVQPGTGNGTGVPGPWYINIPLTTPFLYDPTSGNDVCIDIILDATGWSGQSTAADHVGTTAAPPALCSRIYNTGSHTATTGTVGANYGAVCEFTYIPASGLYAGFSSDVQSGASPLTVNFTDTSFSSDPGGVIAWAWDFDNDGTIDSSLQNPTHVYPTCGVFDVSLTVFDTAHAPDTKVETGMITVDSLVADFSATPTGGFGPLIVNFTDLSTGATSWAWDFDNDGTIDDTTQNPIWAYVTPGAYDVSLTVTNSCLTATETKVGLIYVLDPNAPFTAEILQLQFNEVRGTDTANTAASGLLPASATVNTAGWHVDPNDPLFRGNDAGFGALGHTGGTTNTNIVSTGGALNHSGSMTISWRQRFQSAPPSTAYVFGGAGASWRCFTGGVAGTSLWYRGTPIGDIKALYNVQANPGAWHHFALSIDDAAGVADWYVDGILDSTTPFTVGTHAVLGVTDVHVGYHTSTASTYTQSYDIDDFRIFNRALGAAAVGLLATGSESPSAGASGTSCPTAAGDIAIAGTGGIPYVGSVTFAIEASNLEPGQLSALLFDMRPATATILNLDPWLSGPGCELQIGNLGNLFGVPSATNTFTLPVPIPIGLAPTHIYMQAVQLGSAGGGVSKVLDVNIQQ